MGSYAGVDWAADKHDVRVCDETGEDCWLSRSRTMRRGCGRCAVRCCG